MANNTSNTTNIKLVKLSSGDIAACTITTRAKGSWKWQDAFAYSYYTPVRRMTRLNKSVFIWRAVAASGKYSAPQMGENFRTYPHGTLSNRPVTARDLQALALAAEHLGGVVAVMEGRKTTGK